MKMESRQIEGEGGQTTPKGLQVNQKTCLGGEQRNGNQMDGGWYRGGENSVGGPLLAGKGGTSC